MANKIATIWTKGKEYEYKGLPVGFTIDTIDRKPVTVAFCGLLDLSAVGETEEKAEVALGHVVNAFIEELLDSGKLDQALIHYGWKKIEDHKPTWQVTNLPSKGGELAHAR